MQAITRGLNLVVWSKGGAQPLAQALTFLCKKTKCGLFGIGFIFTMSIPLSDKTLIEITNSTCKMLNFAMFLNLVSQPHFGQVWG